MNNDKNNDILVSIIVPIYNSEKYLEKCVQSLINQNFDNYEVLLINDGSKDSSYKICKEYDNKYNYIKVFNKENGGTSSAKNMGIEKARGEWIVFVDSDDYIDSNYISTLINNINDNIDLVACGFVIEYLKDNYFVNISLPENKEYIKSNEIKDGIYELDYNALLNVNVSKIYRRRILKEKNILFNEKLNTGEDLVFNCEYIKNIRGLLLLKDIIYHYVRRDEVSLVNTYRENLIEMVNKCNIARYNLYEFYSMNYGKYEMLYARSYIDYIATCVPNLYRSNCCMSKKQKEISIKRILDDEKLQKYIRLYDGKFGVITKLFLIMCKIKNVKIFNLVYTILFFIRYKFESIYRKIRKKIQIN
ncbi:glycosyltransferase family 2 protein [Clostridium carnis]